MVRQWREKFLLDRQNVNDEEWSGRPSNSVNDENIENIHALLNEDYHYTIEVGCSHASVGRIVQEMLGY